MNRITKDSGQRDEFSTGARRDNGGSKPVPILRGHPTDVAWLCGFKEFDCSEPLNVLPSHLDGSDPLIPGLAINRLQALFERGAHKYGEDNWQKGIPLQRMYESMMRHLIQAWAGDTAEDHLAAVMWNTAAVMDIEARIVHGDLPEWLGDAGALKYGQHSIQEILDAEEEFDTGHDSSVLNGGT